MALTIALTLQVSGWCGATETEQKVATTPAAPAPPPTCSWLYPSRHLTRPGSGGASFIRAAAPRWSRTRRHCLDAAAGAPPLLLLVLSPRNDGGKHGHLTTISPSHLATAGVVPPSTAETVTAENDNWDKKQFGNQKCISQYMLSSGCQATNRVLNRVPQL